MSSASGNSVLGGSTVENPDWRRRGILHGFVGKPGDYSDATSNQDSRALLRHYGAHSLALVSQVHGNKCLVVESAEVPRDAGVVVLGEADALLIINAEAMGSAQRLLIGIRSADCVPLLCVTSNAYAVIHAGWRGLANGVIARTFEQLRQISGGAIEVCIGPCAGSAAYEVGSEVLDALGSAEFSRPSKSSGKYLLSLGEIAEKQAKDLHAKVVQRSTVCTISNSEWHSHRREGARAGRNLGFICAPAASMSA